MRQVKRLLIALVTLCAATAAQAVDCRMPNGRVVTFQTSDCPTDAATLDASGRVVKAPVPPAVPEPQRKPPAPVSPSATATAPPANPPAIKAPPDLLSVARVTCDYLLDQGAATECSVNVHIFSESTVDMTINDPPRTAWASCVQLAAQIRELARQPHSSGNWKIRMYSPFSGSRPIATCDL